MTIVLPAYSLEPLRDFVDQAVPLLRSRLAEPRAIIEDYLDRERREIS